MTSLSLNTQAHLLERAHCYWDANAGAPLASTATAWLVDWLGLADCQFLGNPSSIHQEGRQARRWVAEAKESVAQALGVTRLEQLIFCASGTEANQAVVRSAYEVWTAENKALPFHWITSSIEHDSLRQLVPWLRARGAMVTEVPVNAEGLFSLEVLETVLQQESDRAPSASVPRALLSLVWVNNETGVRNPETVIAQLAQRFGVPLHWDAAQALGKFFFHVPSLGASWVTFSAHKIGGLSGTGWLWMAPRQKWSPLLWGKQEWGRRGGTENTIGLITLGHAIREHVSPEACERWQQQVGPWRDALQEAVQQVLPQVKIWGEKAPRVANTLLLSVPECRGEGLVMALDLAGYSVSAGSACSSGVLEPSHVLQAMGCEVQEALSAIRISLSAKACVGGESIKKKVAQDFATTLEAITERFRRAPF